MIMSWFKKRSSKKQVAALAVELGLITKKDKTHIWQVPWAVRQNSTIEGSRLHLLGA